VDEQMRGNNARSQRRVGHGATAAGLAAVAATIGVSFFVAALLSVTPATAAAAVTPANSALALTSDTADATNATVAATAKNQAVQLYGA
jgi:hypothetical protein